MATTDETDRGGVTRYPWSDLTAEVVEYHDEPAECTIYPSDAPPEHLLTTWISARSGSFVDPLEMC